MTATDDDVFSRLAAKQQELERSARRPSADLELLRASRRSSSWDRGAAPGLPTICLLFTALLLRLFCSAPGHPGASGARGRTPCARTL